MKKLVVTLLTLLTCGAVQALPVGNPGEASLFHNGICCEGQHCDICDPCFSWCNAWSFRVGFYGNYVFNRHLQVNGADAAGVDNRRIENARISTNAGYLAFNVCDRVDIFTALGSSTLSLDLDHRIFLAAPVAAQLATITFDPRFSWSVGGRATIWECGCFTLGVEGEYMQVSPRFNYLVLEPAFISLDDNYRTRYREWQVGCGVSYTIATSCPNLAFVPYLAIAWSGARLDGTEFTGIEILDRLPQLINTKLWSYAVGTSFTLCDVVGVTAEGRFGAEKALYINGQFRF